MIELAGMKGRTYAVMGLGASGLAAAEALARSGARVLAWDDEGARREAARGKGVALADLSSADLGGAEALVLSPGIPHTHPRPHPVAVRAREAGLGIICDVELLLRANEARAKEAARVIGVTGTNGKSTVTALIGHLLESAGVPCSVGGNLGPAALGLAPQGRGGAYVLELSSYQLERMETAGTDIAVLINIAPDHLDRHGGMEGYVAAKERLFALARPGGTAVIGADDHHCRAIAERLRARGGSLRVIPVSALAPVPGGVYVDKGRLVDATKGAPRPIADLTDALNLQGVHNFQNAAAAAAATLAFGISPAAVAVSLRTYPGLPHRQERVRRIGRVAYINDSKATNPDAAGRALACYDNIFWIAGGRAKQGGFKDLEPVLPRLARAFLIGEAADEIARLLEGRVPYTVSGTLEAAVAAAHAAAQGSGASAVVLLSPACASFDQFANFEARGDAFRALVAGLERER